MCGLHGPTSIASGDSTLIIDGALVARKSVVEGAVSVSLDSCKPGVYVLTLENEHTFKLIKR